MAHKSTRGWPWLPAWLSRTALILLLSAVASLPCIPASKALLVAAYAAMGSMFARLMAQLTVFPPDTGKGPEHAVGCNGQVARLRLASIVLFVLSTVLFVSPGWNLGKGWARIGSWGLAFALCCYSATYFCVNLRLLCKLEKTLAGAADDGKPTR